MERKKVDRAEIERAAKDLFEFAIDREDVKWLLERLAVGCRAKPAKVEYELQLLKIISVGWSLPYHLENSPLKTPLLEIFWNSVQEFSRDLSTTTGLMIGQEIDYFQTLKDRLEMYVKALGRAAQGTEPATVIGPCFAETCAAADDLAVSMMGSKMFLVTVGRVKKFLDALEHQLAGPQRGFRPR